MALNKICSSCGYISQGKKVTKGSFLIELVLWCCFLIPGLIYSIWRLTSKHVACPGCGSSELIPLDSPRGRKLQQELS